MDDNLRVPACGLEWIAEAFGDPGPGPRLRFQALDVPTGVIFDTVALVPVPGMAILNRLIDAGLAGPTVLDGIGHRVRFLVPPGSAERLELLRAERRVPRPLSYEVSGRGGSVRLPAPVTRQDALRRWLIAPRSRTPRLTTLEEILDAVAGYARQRTQARCQMAGRHPAPELPASWSADRSVSSA